MNVCKFYCCPPSKATSLNITLRQAISSPSMFVCITLMQTVVLPPHQGQEDTLVLWSWFWFQTGSSGSVQERRSGPQLQGDPQNQRQEEVRGERRIKHVYSERSLLTGRRVFKILTSWHVCGPERNTSRCRDLRPSSQTLKVDLECVKMERRKLKTWQVMWH